MEDVRVLQRWSPKSLFSALSGDRGRTSERAAQKSGIMGRKDDGKVLPLARVIRHIEDISYVGRVARHVAVEVVIADLGIMTVDFVWVWGREGEVVQ